MKQLSDLLAEAASLFSTPQDGPAAVYNFTLGCFPHGWQFRVANNWYAWTDRGLTYEFGPHPSPEEAVSAFLDYVRGNDISVAELMHK